MATNSEVLKIMVILGNAYPANKLEKTSADLYITLLGDIPGEILLQGGVGAYCSLRMVSHHRGTARGSLWEKGAAGGPGPSGSYGHRARVPPRNMVNW